MNFGIGATFAAGLATAQRLAALQLCKAAGFTVIRDNLGWAWLMIPANLAKVVETKAQCDALGLLYFAPVTLDAPLTEPGGGGGNYPTLESDFVTFLADFATTFGTFTAAVRPWATTVGWEMSGPAQWLPDGVALDKYSGVNFEVAIPVCVAYVRLYNAGKAVAPAGVLVGSSSGDGEYGNVTKFLSTCLAQGLAPDFVTPYDYRNYGGYPFPYWWEGPESPGVPTSYAGVFGRVDQNIEHYGTLSGKPVVISEIGYNIGGDYNGKVITQEIHKSLMCRNAVLAAAGNALAVCLIGLQDEGDCTSGLYNADWTPRPAALALAAMLPTLPAITSIIDNDPIWKAYAGSVLVATWDTSDDSFTYLLAGGPETMNYGTYQNLTDMKAALKIADTVDDATLLQKLETVSRWIDDYCHRRFYVWLQTRYYTPLACHQLLLDADLLAVTTLKSDDDGDRVYETTWDPADYDLLPYNEYPKTAIEVTPMGDYAFPTTRKGVQIVGTWGHGTGETDTPYEDSGATTTEALDTSETGVDVSSGPLVKAGQTVLVESEQMYVRSIATNTVTVVRGVNGTTAVTHDTGKTVYVYRYPGPVIEAATIQTSRIFRRADAPFGVTGSAEFGQASIIARLDPDVRELLNSYRRISVA